MTATGSRQTLLCRDVCYLLGQDQLRGSRGIIDTPWWNFLPEDARKATFDSFAAATPAGRVGKLQDIASAVVFLIGNTFMTGSVIDCDSGLRLVGHRL